MGSGFDNVRRILYWTLPPVLLAFVFLRIDLIQLQYNFSLVDPWLLMAGLLLFPVATLVGALRWMVLLAPYNNTSIPFTYAVKHFWIGLASGYFTPGAIGMDVYRVMVIGKRYGNYFLNMSAILTEKFMSLFVCMVVIILLYPVMMPFSSSPVMTEILIMAYALFLISLVTIIVILLAHHHSGFQRILSAVERPVTQWLQINAIRLRIIKRGETVKLPFRKIIMPLLQPSRLSILLTCSVVIQILAAFASQIFFDAAGYQITFLVNMFLGPIFYFILLIPISFGGIGVREASFIFLYGLFGVPTETALLISFFSMIGGLLSISIGALFIFLEKPAALET
jgi:uncharacterized protein (TIRG00374 family)